MSTRKSYKKMDLDKYVEEYQIELIDEYEKVNSDTKIKGICNTEGCSDIFEKGFRTLILQGGPYCSKCCQNNKKKKIESTCLQKYGFKNPSQSTEIKKKKKDTCFKNYGVENPSQSTEIKKKKEDTCFKNYGVENPSQSQEIREKINRTNLDKYGVENPSQSQEIKGKSRRTNLDKYGVEYPSQSTEIKKKMKDTCFKNYGVENPSQSTEIKKKKKDTCFKNYGVDYPYQSQEICERVNQKKLEKYGCENCKINIVYKLFTNLDCERICSDCSNPKRNPKYQKTKEWLVVRKLREDIPDISFIHNKSVGNECTLQDRENTNGHLYPDIRFELFGFDLIIEVDENKHRGASYSCDERRMYEIIKQLGLPCVFIRYNPDDKKSDYNVLLEMIKEYLEKDMNEIDFNEHSGLKVEYLFY